LYGVPCGPLLVWSVPSDGPVGQFLLDSWWHHQPGATQALSNHGNRINDVFDAAGQIEEDVGVNGDELGPVRSCLHSKAS